MDIIESISQLEAFKCSYGYSSFTFNRTELVESNTLCDAESDLGRKEGRNGKSLVMRSIERYKDTCIQDGQDFQNILTRMVVPVANVTLNTIHSDKRFKRLEQFLFNMITDDIEIEKKKENKFVILKDKAKTWINDKLCSWSF